MFWLSGQPMRFQFDAWFMATWGWMIKCVHLVKWLSFGQDRRISNHVFLATYNCSGMWYPTNEIQVAWGSRNSVTSRMSDSSIKAQAETFHGTIAKSELFYQLTRATLTSRGFARSTRTLSNLELRYYVIIWCPKTWRWAWSALPILSSGSCDPACHTVYCHLFYYRNN